MNYGISHFCQKTWSHVNLNVAIKKTHGIIMEGLISVVFEINMCYFPSNDFFPFFVSVHLLRPMTGCMTVSSTLSATCALVCQTTHLVVTCMLWV